MARSNLFDLRKSGNNMAKKKWSYEFKWWHWILIIIAIFFILQKKGILMALVPPEINENPTIQVGSNNILGEYTVDSSKIYIDQDGFGVVAPLGNDELIRGMWIDLIQCKAIANFLFEKPTSPFIYMEFSEFADTCSASHDTLLSCPLFTDTWDYEKGKCHHMHEFSHLVINMQLPSWGNEGFAQYMMVNSPYSIKGLDHRLFCNDQGRAQGSFDIVPYSDLLTSGGYETAACFWTLLETKYGFEMVQDIIKSLNDQTETNTGFLTLVNSKTGESFSGIDYIAIIKSMATPEIIQKEKCILTGGTYSGTSCSCSYSYTWDSALGCIVQETTEPPVRVFNEDDGNLNTPKNPQPIKEGDKISMNIQPNKYTAFESITCDKYLVHYVVELNNFDGSLLFEFSEIDRLELNCYADGSPFKIYFSGTITQEPPAEDDEEIPPSENEEDSSLSDLPDIDTGFFKEYKWYFIIGTIFVFFIIIVLASRK